MAVDKILKESVTLEQSKEIMGISISVEEAVLKLYKYISENVNDDKILDHVISLKTSISKFNLGLQGKMKAGADDVIASQSEKSLIDNPKVERNNGVLEAFEPEADKAEVIQVHEPEAEPGDMKQEINERVSLEEKVKATIDISSEWKALEEKVTKKSFGKLIEKLQSEGVFIGEVLGEAVRNQYESKVDDFKYQTKDVKTLNESINSLYDWADANKVVIIAKKQKSNESK